MSVDTIVPICDEAENTAGFKKESQGLHLDLITARSARLMIQALEDWMASR